MPTETRIVAPAFPYGFVRLEDGTKVAPPEDWVLLEPGDATLTRRVKEAGPSWTVQSKKGRKVFSHGVWAPELTVERVRKALEAERDTPEYKRRLEAQRARAAKKQDAYVDEFTEAVEEFLGFPAVHADVQAKMARAIATHATPVGSGTVARTKRIPVAQRAEAAVIAWMRHQTTAYDHLNIPRVKGKRREVRAMLAKESRRVLERYRRGEPVASDCPLAKALRSA